MPWTEKPDGPGFYYAMHVERDVHGRSEFKVVEVDDDGCQVDQTGSDWSTHVDRFRPRWLSIPSPEVLAAMEEFVAAVREGIGLNPALGMSPRVALALRDLIRAECIGWKP